MIESPADIWTDEMSVVFTSYWGWAPETWGTLGWTGAQGLARRTNLLKELTDPFIAVIYVTDKTQDIELRGEIVGFYLVSHETGHRNEFTHPRHHPDEPTQWEHSLRALRAFTYLPEQRLAAAGFDPSLSSRARSVAKWGEVITDRSKIDLLRRTPWVESEVYVAPGQKVETGEEFEPRRGLTRADPANHNGYVVSSSAQKLERQLYLLQLGGSADAYLGRAAAGRRIYKVGLSASPELRKQSLQKAMPIGAFQWSVYHQSGTTGKAGGYSFNAAVNGEYAMKKSLVDNSEWLGGEFYLATESDVEVAWKLGELAACSF